MLKKIVPVLLLVSLVTNLLTFLPFVKLEYQWVAPVHVIAILIFLFSIKGLPVILNDTLKYDPIFYALIALHGFCFYLAFKYPLDGGTDGVRYWAEYRTEFIKYVSEYEYYRLKAGEVRAFSSIHTVFFYSFCSLYSPQVLNKPRKQARLIALKFHAVILKSLSSFK